MVVVDTLTKVAHFIVVKFTYSTSEIAQVFIKDIVRLHGIPRKIVREIDTRFTSRLWKELFIGFGIIVSFSTTYHPQIDG